MKRSPIRRRRRTKHQLANVDHAEYLQWIHTQPCAACGTRQNIQAAHAGRGGMGMKHGSDAEVIPLCGAGYVNGTPEPLAGCHAQHDGWFGRFSYQKFNREQLRAWDAHQIAVHRGRFEARFASRMEVPF